MKIKSSRENSVECRVFYTALAFANGLPPVSTLKKGMEINSIYNEMKIRKGGIHIESGAHIHIIVFL